ncbi:MAG: DUF2339 domain-containing protein [Xanthomonadaceae bacterium]|nr:DUF2339 domain-containing protein [Xanthomonadaceae bacterium]
MGEWYLTRFLIMVLVLALAVASALLIGVLVSLAGLKRRVGALEHHVHRQAAAQSALRPTESSVQDSNRYQQSDTSAAQAPPPTSVHVPEPPVVVVRNESVPEPVPAASTPPPLPRLETLEHHAPEETTQWVPPAPREPEAPDLASWAFSAMKRWFTEGNVPVKIGVLVLFAGVAALLKYVSDQGWLVFPIELRLATVSAAALGALLFAWSKRERHRGFALSLQGGAIGVLLLTVFAAFKLYKLIPLPAAFGLSVVLVFAAGILAVLQNARALAVSAILAGFLAPIWLSTDSGNHVALFSYYAILNAAIFGIAWKRTWHGLNLLGFVFTFGIGTVWGVTRYLPSQFASTEPFLILFFCFYLLIPVINAVMQAKQRIDLADRCLIFVTPPVAFLLQAGMLHDERMLLAFSAIALAAIYIALSVWLRSRRGHTLLVQSYAALAIGFATLAVPLALSARITAGMFAVEGTVLIWLGLRQRQWLYRVGGVLLQLAAAVAFMVASADTVPAFSGEWAVLNPAFVSALLITLSGWTGAWCYREQRFNIPATLLYLWGMLWWVGNGLHEIYVFVPRGDMLHATLGFVALTGWLAAEACRWRPALALGLTSLSALALALPVALIQTGMYGQPFAGNGLWAWLAYGVLGIRSLWCLRSGNVPVAKGAQFAWWLVWPLSFSLLLAWMGERFDLDEGWCAAGWVLPWCIVLVLSLFRWNWLTLPLGSTFDSLRRPLQWVLLTVAGLWWFVALKLAGGSAPLPWVPLVNPMELMLVAVLVLGMWVVTGRAVGQEPGRARWEMPAAAGFLLISFMTLRAVHHWGGEAWSPSLPSSVLAQTSLTVVWSILGVLGWVIGSRRGQRAIWLAGAVLMAIVLGKLALIDRGNLGNALGIASFIAYGMLCVTVGYFAPAPPRSEKKEGA